jgi:hypothetical protein
MDNSGNREYALPPRHDFEWTPVTRDAELMVDRRQVLLVDSAVHVSTAGGELRVASAGDEGGPVHVEPVAEPLQSLADTEVAYARVGALVLMRIRPYKETADRYLVYNTHSRAVVRLDGIGQACQRLPDDRGIVFPGGYCLSAGATRTFDVDTRDMEFERMIRPAGGADVLYVYHARGAGRSLLQPYNVVRDEVLAPIEGHGCSLFDDGTMVVLPVGAGGPARVHPLQVWRSPFRDEPPAPAVEGPLRRIGDAELVRAIADCLALSRAAQEAPASTAGIEALVTAGARLLDRHHWLGDADVGDLRTPVSAVRDAASDLLREHERVRARIAAARVVEDEASERIAVLSRRVDTERPTTTAGWVRRLADLRAAQGQLATVREVPHADQARLDALTATLEAATGDAGRRAVEFLAGPDAFTPYHAALDRLAAGVRDVTTAADAEALAARIDAEVDGLRTVTEIVAGLAGGAGIAATADRAVILERVGTVLSGLNRTRAALEARVRELRAAADRAVFAAESALLRQALTAALALSDSPRRCDAELAALLVRLEDLESRFADDDDQRAALSAHRADIGAAFAARKQALLDERARRIERVSASCERILTAVGHRAAELSSLDEVTTYFAADPLLGRLRALAAELRRLGDPVRAGDLEARVVAAREDAARAVRDRQDLYDDGGATIRLGAHRFPVNTEPVDLSLVPDGDGLAVAVTGTGYRRPLRDDAFAATRRFWDRPVASESREVYRAEYLAARLLAEHGPGLAARSPAELATLTGDAAAAGLGDGYVLGVHDRDATAILSTLLDRYATAGLLRYPPDVRAAAQLFHACAGADPRLAGRAAALVAARDRVGAVDGVREFAGELTAAAHRVLEAAGLPTGGELAGDLVGAYLVEELAAEPAGFVVSARARDLVRRFRLAHGDPVGALGGPAARHQVASAWLRGFAGSRDAAFVPEAVALLACDVPRYDSDAELSATVDGLLGTHPRITDGRLEFRLDDLLARTRAFAAREVPAYREYQAARGRLLARERDRLGLDEHRARVPASFVRNRLIDEVYLPLIGDNLAQQLGTVGGSRGPVDRSGLLVLVSPPGYGKTTLVEYVAARLGLLLVTVNGPALGAGVTSLDPARAPDAAARREVEKINLALDLGTNVMLYLDDIQHTSPELLQKFVPLCDAGRRMDSVRDGRAVSVDLRGKRFAVCLAGNPYTESGRRFRLPDMLANRADVWNLGEVLAGREDLFELSYLENALTVNPVLAAVSHRDPADLPVLLRLAGAASGRSGAEPTVKRPRPETGTATGDSTARTSHACAAADLAEIRQVLAHLLRVRAVVLAVNRAYIASAAQDDAARTEPPFLLQGSYRDMNAIARRVRPAMNTDEVEALIDEHYLAEAKPLGSNAEANLLKLAGLRGRRTPEQAARWEHVTAAYRRRVALGGGTDDPIGRAVNAVELLTDRLEAAILHAANGHRR